MLVFLGVAYLTDQHELRFHPFLFSVHDTILFLVVVALSSIVRL